MNRITEVIFDKEKKIRSVLKDELSIFSETGVPKLNDIILEESKETVAKFFESMMIMGRISNESVNVFLNGERTTFYFSGIYWLDYFIVRVSREALQIIPLSEGNGNGQDSPILKSVHVHEKGVDEYNEISRLNHELQQIQRELTKKNINLSSLIERLEELATTDALTGIYSRRAIIERAETEIKRASREGRAYGLAILDLDDFKRINDQFGHQMGDKALKITSKCLTESTRQYDAAGRIGGDEFLVFFSVDSKSHFTNILYRLLSEINNSNMDISGELTIKIKASIGAVFVESQDHDREGIARLMKKADDALYNAKDDGGNTIKIEELN